MLDDDIVKVGDDIYIDEGGLMWESFVAHLFDPWSEIEVIDWWDCVVDLIGFENVVVLAWWVHS